MANEAMDVAVTILQQQSIIGEKIAALRRRRGDLLRNIDQVAMNKASGKTIDEGNLRRLEDAMKSATNLLGVLRMAKSELLDGLPTIRDATGKLRIAVTDLQVNAQLFAKAKQRIEKVTGLLSQVDELIKSILRLVGVAL